MLDTLISPEWPVAGALPNSCPVQLAYLVHVRALIH